MAAPCAARGGSGAAAARWLRSAESDGPEGGGGHPLEQRWARQVDLRFRQLAVLLAERRVRSVPQVEWMDSSVAAAVERATSEAAARQQFFEGMIAVEPRAVEQLLPTPEVNLGRGFADTAQLGQRMRQASHRYYGTVAGQWTPPAVSPQPAPASVDGAPGGAGCVETEGRDKPRRRSHTSSTDGSEGELAGPVEHALSSFSDRALTPDGTGRQAAAGGVVASDDNVRARTTEGVVRRPVSGAAEMGRGLMTPGARTRP